jgi:hypothetical protein
MRRGTVVALALAATLVTIYGAWARGVPDQNKTLIGVPSVYVFVNELSEDLIQAGLSTETLRTDVELRLRAVGIRLPTTEEEWAKTPGRPYLYLTVTGIRNKAESGKLLGYAASVDLEFYQDVHLDREPTVGCVAATWAVGGIGGGPTVDIVRQAVRNYADRFANAYLAANPKS